ncbi:hypothetical protein, partial [Vibrio metoecus]|uniref:hypothetical protein n=2 Tax=Vibrio metoecus TaxID=1481663 RepID=UPI001C3ECFDF
AMSTQQGVQGMFKLLIHEHSMAAYYQLRLQQTNCVIERMALVALFELLFTQTPPEPDKTRSSN